SGSVPATGGGKLLLPGRKETTFSVGGTGGLASSCLATSVLVTSGFTTSGMTSVLVSGGSGRGSVLLAVVFLSPDFSDSIAAATSSLTWTSRLAGLPHKSLPVTRIG